MTAVHWLLFEDKALLRIPLVDSSESREGAMVRISPRLMLVLPSGRQIDVHIADDSLPERLQAASHVLVEEISHDLITPFCYGAGVEVGVP